MVLCKCGEELKEGKHYFCHKCGAEYARIDDKVEVLKSLSKYLHTWNDTVIYKSTKDNSLYIEIIIPQNSWEDDGCDYEDTEIVLQLFPLDETINSIKYCNKSLLDIIKAATTVNEQKIDYIRCYGCESLTPSKYWDELDIGEIEPSNLSEFDLIMIDTGSNLKARKCPVCDTIDTYLAD